MADQDDVSRLFESFGQSASQQGYRSFHQAAPAQRAQRAQRGEAALPSSPGFTQVPVDDRSVAKGAGNEDPSAEAIDSSLEPTAETIMVDDAAAASRPVQPIFASSVPDDVIAHRDGYAKTPSENTSRDVALNQAGLTPLGRIFARLADTSV